MTKLTVEQLHAFNSFRTNIKLCWNLIQQFWNQICITYIDLVLACLAWLYKALPGSIKKETQNGRL